MSRKNRNNQQHNSSPESLETPAAETTNQSEGSVSSADDLAALAGAADQVDAEAQAVEGSNAGGDQAAPGADDQQAGASVSVDDVLPAAEAIILAVRGEVVGQCPSAERVLDDPTCRKGAERLAPLLLKYNVMPPWLKMLIEQYRDEFMFAAWFAGTAWGVYKAVKEDERAAAAKSASDQK